MLIGKNVNKKVTIEIGEELPGYENFYKFLMVQKYCSNLSLLFTNYYIII